MSRRLAALEAQLDTALFDRTSDGLRPTAALERLMPLAEEVDHAMSDFRRAVDGFETTPAGSVRLSAPPGVVEHLIAPALPRFFKKYPGISLDLDGSISYADLTRREADIALRVSRPQAGDLIATRLGQASDTVFASKKVVARMGQLEALDEVEWITWSHELAQIPSTQWVSRQVSTSRIVLRTNRIHAQIAAAQAGVGAVLQPTTYFDFAGCGPSP